MLSTAPAQPRSEYIFAVIRCCYRLLSVFLSHQKQNNKQAMKPDGEDKLQHARSTLESNNYHGNTVKKKSQDRNVMESACIFSFT